MPHTLHGRPVRNSRACPLRTATSPACQVVTEQVHVGTQREIMTVISVGSQFGRIAKIKVIIIVNAFNQPDSNPVLAASTATDAQFRQEQPSIPHHRKCVTRVSYQRVPN